ncbi:hypothetical protein [Ruegeria sediminis]|uniref:hypothetical protein n=1 Tax=Ruegeria sediminis TaxID=2583820 RepID=UPI001C558547|nr:hypothetical protein [Ruegeria sediminis]
MPTLALLIAIALIVSYLTLGHDRSAELSERAMEWLENRRPELAAKLRRKFLRLGGAANSVFVRIPERWTQGIHLPDYGPSGELPEKMREDPFERLAQDKRGRAD